MWYLILLIVGIGAAMWFAKRQADSDAGNEHQASAPATSNVWERSGAYACDVAGESHYQEALRLAVQTLERHGNTPLLALLTPESNNAHDSNAVSVRIAGQLVGHLPREVAPEYRKLLAREGIPLQPVYAYAKVTGGFDLGDGTRAHLGLRLDIKDLEKS